MESSDIVFAHLDERERELLARYHFDAAAFAHLRNELSHGRFGLERNIVAGPNRMPPHEDFTAWPEAGAQGSEALQSAGEHAIAAGNVAVAILNGGMATRFGGRVKGVVEVLDDKSFLAIKLGAIAACGGAVPVFLMNSFATDTDTRAHLEAHQYFGLDPKNVHIVHQNISVRLTPRGDLFRDTQGGLSMYAPGHGDLLGALTRDAAFARFAKRPGALVAVSNVDNLGATLEPRVLGAHLHAGQQVTVEVAKREAGDAGGAPVWRGDRLEVLEGFRFPHDFATDALPVFNTNSFVINADTVRDDYPLTWFRADKKVQNAAVVQFERLVGEITSFVSSNYLQVPRSGPEGRFMPVKTPQDIDAVKPGVRARFKL